MVVDNISIVLNYFLQFETINEHKTSHNKKYI